jgi:cell division transport system permease protein
MAKKKRKSKKFRIRNAGITSVVSMMLLLFVIGLFISLLFVGHSMGEKLKETINFSIVLSDETTENQVSELTSFIKNKNISNSIEYISKEQALTEHIEMLGDNPAEFLGWNPLFASIEVKLKSDFAHADSISKIESQLKSFSTIQKIVYQKDVINIVNENVKRLSIFFLGLTVLLVVISFVLINNTVRLRIYSDRFLINTMRLVGAKSWFVRKPYVQKGLLNGLLAAVFAILLLIGLGYYLRYDYGLDFSIFTIEIMLMIGGFIVLIGMFLSAISSYFAVGRYVRMRGDDMYLI